jgi:hypothetical protein
LPLIIQNHFAFTRDICTVLQFSLNRCFQFFFSSFRETAATIRKFNFSKNLIKPKQILENSNKSKLSLF